MSSPTIEERTADTFFMLGAEYYAVARCASLDGVMFIRGVLFHHALEMFLKGYLARTLSLDDLQKFGHDLIQLWEEVKLRDGNIPSHEFDHVVSKLDQFWSIRYPNRIVNEKPTIEMRYGAGPSLAVALLGHAPTLNLDIEQLEQLVTRISELASLEPHVYFASLPDQFTRELPIHLLTK